MARSRACMASGTAFKTLRTACKASSTAFTAPSTARKALSADIKTTKQLSRLRAMPRTPLVHAQPSWLTVHPSKTHYSITHTVGENIRGGDISTPPLAAQNKRGLGMVGVCSSKGPPSKLPATSPVEPAMDGRTTDTDKEFGEFAKSGSPAVAQSR